MDQIKLFNFADFFFNISKEELDEEYELYGEIGEQPDPEQIKIQELIRKNQAEILIEQGRKFKEKYLQLKAESTIKNSENDFAHSDLALAYRKRSGNSEKAEDDDSHLLELIKKAKKNAKS